MVNQIGKQVAYTIYNFTQRIVIYGHGFWSGLLEFTFWLQYHLLCKQGLVLNVLCVLCSSIKKKNNSMSLSELLGDSKSKYLRHMSISNKYLAGQKHGKRKEDEDSGEYNHLAKRKAHCPGKGQTAVFKGIGSFFLQIPLAYDFSRSHVASP